MLLSTDAVHPAGRITYWHDVVCETVVALDCRSAIRDGFFGSIASHEAGSISLIRVVSQAQAVARTRKLIAQASDDVMLVSLLIQGDGCVLQDGREARVSSGDLVLKDPTRPYEMLFKTPFSKWMLKVPRAALRQRLGTPEAMTATCVSAATPIGRLTTDFLMGFAALPDTTPPSVHERLAGQALDLIAMALMQHAPALVSQGAHRTMLAVRMRSFIEQHLHRADLDGSLIAEAFRMSPRSVRDVFAAHGTTPGRYILARRLDRARVLLSDPTQHRRAIADIAYAAGLSDQSYFSHSFRRAYGHSPREAREMAGSGRACGVR
jgi:AraC-like DNA-binding protein